MKYEIKYKPSYSMLVVNLEQGESIVAESGAMTYMDPNIEVHTRKREKSILGSIGLSVLGRQSFWVNEYTASQGSGEAAFVAAPVGDIEVLQVTSGQGFVIQKSAFIASTGEVDLDIKWEGFTKGLFGQGLFMIKGNHTRRRRPGDTNHRTRRHLHPDEKPQRIRRLALDTDGIASPVKSP